MNIVPVFRCRNLAASVAFYTTILDFQLKYPAYFDECLANGVVDLINNHAELQLSIYGPTNDYHSSALARLSTPAEVDALFATYTARGLDQSHHTESPVHLAPLDQTWGIHEFYVTDPDGNTLCFGAPLP